MAKTIKVFLSSPSDVVAERNRVKLIVERLNAERLDLPGLELVRWEDDFYRATSTFQAQIEGPGDCDLVICIFWKRLGTDLPESFQRPDGSLPTGSEYEFEAAVSQAIDSASKLPDVFVYRKMAKIYFALETLELESAEFERFRSFWRRWFQNERGHFVAAFQTFDDTDAFERQIEDHLRRWLDEREAGAKWIGGAPYRGLDVFDVEHAAIFFGRRREIERARARLVTSAIAGKPFLLISGPSGSGKSSLARAGLIPRLTAPGGLSTLGETARSIIVKPSDLEGKWQQRFAEMLFSDPLLAAAFGAGDFTTPSALAEQIGRGGIATVLSAALVRAKWLMVERGEAPRDLEFGLVVLIDQLEEMFGWRDEDVVSFSQFLFELTTAQRVLVIATIRSDFLHRLNAASILRQLIGRDELQGDGQVERLLEISPPSRADFREIIRAPAELAGCVFESDGERDLAALIEEEAEPAAMPAVQYLLRELYELRDGDLLTLTAFDSLQGVSGVMAARAEAVLASVSPGVAAALPRVLRALVRVNSGDGPPSARVIAATSFAAGSTEAELVDALRGASLISSDRDMLRIAHETLLERWDRAARILAEDQRLFAGRERLELDSATWSASSDDVNRRATLLTGYNLALGEELLERWGPEAIADRRPELPEFIRTSSAKERWRRRRVQIVSLTIGSVFMMLAVAATWFFIEARTEERRSRASLLLVRGGYQEALAAGNPIRALRLAAESRAISDGVETRSAVVQAVLAAGPNIDGLTRLPMQPVSLAWDGVGNLAIGGVGGALWRWPRPGGSVAPTNLGDLPKPLNEDELNTPLLLASRGTHMIAMLEDGRIADLDGNGSANLLAIGPPEPLSAAAADRTGKLLVTVVSATGTVRIGSCVVQTKVRCRILRELELGAQAAAVAANGSRVAIGTMEGQVVLTDASGQEVEPRFAPGGAVAGLALSDDGSRVAVGSDVGAVTILANGGRSVRSISAASGSPVRYLAWSTDGAYLAYACHSNRLCIWSERTGLFELPRHETAIVALAWDPVSGRLASASDDGDIRLWRLGAPRLTASCALTPRSALGSLAASSKGQLIAGSEDARLLLWAPSKAGSCRAERIEAAPRALSFSAAGDRLVVVGEGDRAITLYDRNFRTVVSPELDSEALWDAEFMADGRLAAPVSDGRLASWSPPGRMSGFVPGKLPEGAVALVAGKDALYSADGNSRIFAWRKGRDPEMLAPRIACKEDCGVGTLALDRDGRWLAAGGNSTTLHLFRVDGSHKHHALPVGANILDLGFSRDGALLASLDVRDRMSIWTMPGTKLMYRLSLSRPKGGDAAFAGTRIAFLDSKRIAIAMSEGRILLLRADFAAWSARAAHITAVDVPN